MTNTSKLCLGTAQLGMHYGINNMIGKPSLEESRSIVSLAINNGITAFDTAPEYGDSEEILGKCLDGTSRGKLMLISKVPPTDWSKSKEDIIERVNNTLNKTLKDLGIKILPVYLFHRFNDIEKENSLILNELISIKQKGLIGKIGVSIYTPEEAERSLNIEGVEVIQVPFNLIDKRLLENGFLSRAMKKGITVLARSVFLQGLFFKKDIPDKLKVFKPYQKKIIDICAEEDMSMEELALRYVLGIAGINSVIIGAETTDQLQGNIKIARKPKLSSEIAGKIDKLGSAPESIINPGLWN